MIIKNITYKNKTSFRHVINYILKEADKEKPFLLTRYIKDREAEAITRNFYANEQLRNIKRKNNVVLNMDILSFHSDSSEFLTDKKLKDLTRKYISLKCPRSISCVVIHREKKNHIHVHLVYGIEYKTGKSIRISKERFADIKNELEIYQKERYPELIRSQINHSKGGQAKIKQQEYAMQIQRGVLSKKMQIIEKLKQAYTLAQSKKQFFDLVQEFDYELYERNGKVQGIKHNNKKYRFKTLGYWKKALEELDRDLTLDKKREMLQQIRKRQKEREQEKDREQDY